MTTVPDYSAITSAQRDTWARGDFNVVALQVMTASESLCAAVDPWAGDRVLDVACGSGNAALIAARRHCEVIGIDYVPALIERAKQRSMAEGTTIDFRVGDAQALPFPDRQFDSVISVFGVMFAPDQAKAASELLRVCRPGGTIGLASWMPDGFGGDFFRAVSKYVPPPPGLQPPVRWGTEQGLKDLFGAGARSIRSQKRTLEQHFESAEHMLDTFRTYFGPMHRAFEVTQGPAQEALRADVLGVYEKYGRKGARGFRVACDYLETIAEKA